MRIRHIYITKEGEPMANPEMEYPKQEDLYDYDPVEKLHSIDKYHSGLLPFEDFNEIKDEMFYQTTGGPHIDMPFESIFNPDTIIPVDLEAEVVEKWKFSLDSQWRDVTEDHGPKTEEEREAQGNEYRKVLRIKP